jgi:two-component system chemotaxis response regulator CheY
MAAVIIVEDIEAQAALLRRYVRARHSVVGTVDGADRAVQLAREEAPDVVIMDLNLNEGNGLAATASIKSLDETISVIISTIHVDDEVRDQAAEAGADAYLFKPYTQEDLLDTIATVRQA